MQPPLTPGNSWTATLLHLFTRGQMPEGNLVMGQNGAIYGTTIGGISGKTSGMIYELVP